MKNVSFYTFTVVCLFLQPITLWAISWLMMSPVSIYLLKLKSRNTRKGYEICSKLTMKHQNEDSHGPFSIVSIIHFEQVNVRENA